MNIVLDVILLTVIVFCAVYYFRKGFASSVVGFARFVLAAALSFAFSGLVANLLEPAIQRAVGSDGSESANAAYIAYALAFVLVFIVALFAVGLMERFFRRVIRRLPIIGTIDGVFGGGVGLLVGFLFAALLVELYAALAAYAGGSVFSMQALYDSTIAEFLYENNLFGLIFKSLS
ncbi:MAG: CvpA family protein [Clostridia bacterium]|nr:CvpA family protein [Clostridia bacterium]